MAEIVKHVGSGALVQLVAYGVSDVYLIGNP
jgi:hypothetical protein